MTPQVHEEWREALRKAEEVLRSLLPLARRNPHLIPEEIEIMERTWGVLNWLYLD